MARSNWHGSALLLFAPLTLAACDDAAAGGAWGGTVTDSAGVVFVANPADGMWGEGEGWTVREALSVGGALDGDPAYQFGMVTGVGVDAEENLYVLDQQAREVRVFDPEGRWLRSFGKPGSGPGEMGMQAAALLVVGDEVWVPDLQNQRVNRYALDGTPVGEVRIDLQRGIPVRWDGPVEGRPLAQIRVLNLVDPEAPRGGDPIVAYGPDGAVVDTLMTLGMGETLSMERGGPSVGLFAPEPVWDLGSDGRLVTGRNHEFRLEVRDPSGALERVVTLPRERAPVTEQDREGIFESLRQAAADQGAPPQAVEMMLQRMTIGDHFPVFMSVLVGPEGTLWTQRVRPGSEAAGSGAFQIDGMGSPDWDVFDADGRYLGVVSFPERAQPLLVRGDRVYAVAWDAMDVQRVAVYRVDGPGG